MSERLTYELLTYELFEDTLQAALDYNALSIGEQNQIDCFTYIGKRVKELEETRENLR